MLQGCESVDGSVRAVLDHLCSDRCHGFGLTAEHCETRGDCVIVVTCPACGKCYTLDDEQYEQLLRWTSGQGTALACGIEPLYA